MTLVGHSTGGGEVVRYLSRHGTERVRSAVLIGAVPPFMLQTDDNPEGTPLSAFDDIRRGVEADRSQYWIDLSAPFYGANREGNKISQGLRDQFWRLGMQVGLKPAYDCIKAFSETDFRAEMGGIGIPVFVAAGSDDQIVPIKAAAEQSVKLLPKAGLKIYQGAPHGISNGLRRRAQRRPARLPHHRPVPGGLTARPARSTAATGRSRPVADLFSSTIDEERIAETKEMLSGGW